MPGQRAICGAKRHGRVPTDGGLGVCFACGRAGNRDGTSKGWKHVGSGPYWSDLGTWAATIGEGWPHERDIVASPFQVGECVCRRSNCVAGMYFKYKRQVLKQEIGSLDKMQKGQSSPMGRYPSTAFQVRVRCKRATAARVCAAYQTMYEVSP